jgi:hypothetical protein
VSPLHPLTPNYIGVDSLACAICEARAHRGAIEALVESGGDIEAVRSLLEDRGIKSSTYALRKHFAEHTDLKLDSLHASLLSKVKPTKAEREAKAADRAARQAEVAEYLDDVATIDLDRVLATIGVRRQAESMGDVLNLVQRMSLALHTASSAIAFDRLERFMRDPEGRKYPSTELRGASLTSEMVSNAFGYSQAANLQTALDTVEKAGYRVVESDGATTNPKVATAD